MNETESTYVEVPVSAAREIAERYQTDIVIINAWDAVHQLIHTATYGVTAVDKRFAAHGGHLTSQALGADLSRMQNFSDYRDERIAELEGALTRFVKGFEDYEALGYLSDQDIWKCESCSGTAATIAEIKHEDDCFVGAVEQARAALGSKEAARS